MFSFFLQAPAGGGGIFGSPLVLMLGMFIIFYFFFIRPQQKKQKEHQAMLAALAKGDRVITSGGIFGTVVGVKDDVIVLRIDENTKIEIVKSNIATKV